MTNDEKEKRSEQRATRAKKEAEDIEASKIKISQELGIPRNHPKFESAWRIAWDYGHASGLSEVELHFREISELLT